jgi:mannose-6-phosphate isomerase-like protein (cupin superfamily)
MIIPPGAGGALTGTNLVVGDWSMTGEPREVAPLHVHHADDEAWHVISGSLRFRFETRELVAEAGSTVLVPAGVPHTFGNAGPEGARFFIVLPTRLDELINHLHASEPADHPAIYQRYESELLE